MNLSRAITGVLSSHTRRSSKWLSIHQFPFAAHQLASLSADAAAPAKRVYRRAAKPTPEADPPKFKPSLTAKFREESSSVGLPRPKAIPFQTKVANQVHLIGSVGVPVELQTLPNGSYSAVSVLSSETTKGSPQFWIPVIFLGDLAQVAARHLKENDVVYVTGQLSGEALPHTNEDARTNIQVLADSLSFVQNECSVKVDDKSNEKVEQTSGFAEENNLPDLHLWKDLLANPHDWCDNRLGKGYSKRAAFRHKSSGQQLWINESTPEWILSKLETLWIGEKANTDYTKKMVEKSIENPWDDLVLNPHNWWDNRTEKQNGLINHKFPDFKHKETQKALWLDSGPSWVLAKLDNLVFDTSKFSKKRENSDSPMASKQATKQNNSGSYPKNFGSYPKYFGKSKQEKYAAAASDKKNEEDLWKSLVDNPNQWWDNRSNKLKKTSPDFKHKDTGDALWLSSTTPRWILDKLPPVTTGKGADRIKAFSSSDTLLS
ncbi:protein OSB3, chloroplastic/mitochondrial [Canna indica]|uniref:Protein OSB3, chloroplastic/mitochondrial n=1 Tax=Canna indica TaxID=4628 RepID=A0AAQ3KRV3_9LILI|nr:protein OSB3, chloroplastic/mitochondrial [Canna indica]